MNVNNLKPTCHDKTEHVKGAGILMGNLVVITCIYGFYKFNNLSFLYNLFCFKIQISCK